ESAAHGRRPARHPDPTLRTPPSRARRRAGRAPGRADPEARAPSTSPPCSGPMPTSRTGRAATSRSRPPPSRRGRRRSERTLDPHHLPRDRRVQDPIGAARCEPALRAGTDSIDAEPLAPGLVAAGGEAEDPDEEPLHSFADRARDRAVPADGGLELALQPALELLEIRERERLELQHGRVVEGATARGREVEGIAALHGRARVAEAPESSRLRIAGLGPD